MQFKLFKGLVTRFIRQWAITVGLLLFFLGLSPAQVALAQTITATIWGTVKDTTGAVVPGASVEIQNIDTGASRTTQTDARGAYRAPQLPPGSYEVEVSAPGFKAQVRTGITLSVGQGATIDLVLQVGEVTETVTITGEAPLVETTGSATVSGLVTSQGIRDLPLNARSFEQLAILQPGVAANTQSGGDFFEGRTLKISIGGARGRMNTYLLDGTTIDNIWNSTPGSATGNLLGVETIREFRVLVNNYSAEYGKNAGGVVNIVTLSGTNTLHGSVYEFLRNDKLDAKNFFDDPKRPIPPFKRNSFGASLGGPIRKDKLFFHANYEGLRERRGISIASPVPDKQMQQGFLPDPKNPGQLINVGVSPLIRPYLNLFPLPNGRSFGNGVGEWLGSYTAPSTENYFSGRIDYTASEKNSIFGRYTFDDADVRLPGGLPILGVAESSRYHYLTLQNTYVFSPTFLNTLRFGFARNLLDLEPLQLVKIDPTLNFNSLPFGAGGGISTPALATGIRGDTLANCLVCPAKQVTNNFEWADTVDWIKGRHSAKAGVQISRKQLNAMEKVYPAWDYFFPDLTSLLQAQSLFMLGSPLTGDYVRGQRQTMYAAFFQDDLRIRPNFSLSLAVRYENMRAPVEVNGKGSRWVNPTDPAPTVFGKKPLHDDFTKFGFMPRIGFSWDPFSTGKTAVRGGFGLFYDQLTWAYNQGVPVEPPFGQFALKLFPSFPKDTIQLGPPYFLESIAPTHAPYVMHFNLNVQRQIAQSMEFTIGYAGSSGVHLVIPGDIFAATPQILPDGRRFFPPNSQRVNPAVASTSVKMTGAHSTYHALMLSFNRRFSKGLAAQVNYTFSKNIDDSSEEQTFTNRNSRKNTQDVTNFRAGRGTGSFNRKSIFSANVDYQLPFGANLQGPLKKLVGGWAVSAIITAYSGFPVSVLEEVNQSRNGVTPGVNEGMRPDLCAGANNSPVLGDPAKWMDPKAFCLQPAGFYGNLGRNTVLGPGLANFDFSVTKTVNLYERFRLEFLSQFFNLFNHPNFDVPSNAVFGDASGVPLPNFGVISRTGTSSRQMQFALKLLF